MDMKNLNFWLKWIATAFLVAFAILTILKIEPLNIWVANIATIIWLVWSIRIRELSLIVVNTTLLLVYFVGLFV